MVNTPLIDVYVSGLHSGEGDYEKIYVPVIEKTTAGTLLAFAEARRNGYRGYGGIEILLRRSTDLGNSWGEIQIVHENGDFQIENPCPIVDRDTGRIILLTCTDHMPESEIHKGKEHREVWLSHSDDDGVTWSARQNITPEVRRDHWHWYATGPAAGIQIRAGNHKGRLVAPANHGWLQKDGSHELACHSIYSDDGGETWHIGSASGPGGSETQIAEVAEDLLIQDIRMHTHWTGFRAKRYSRDGGETWDEMVLDEERPCTVCQGSMISLSSRPDGVHNMLVTSNPSPLGERFKRANRERLVSHMSTDGGRTWDKTYVIEPSRAAYSTIVQIDEERIGVLYDRGTLESDRARISFRTFYVDDYR